MNKLCGRCNKFFIGNKSKCAPCREYLSKWSKAARKTTHGAAVEKKQQSRYSHSAKGKTKGLRNLHSVKGQATQERRKKKVREDARFRLMVRLQSKMSRMLRTDITSDTAAQMTEFQSADEFVQHMGDTMDTGMTWENYGFGDDKWNIGHRIAKACYDHKDEENVRRCWSRANLFAQWQKENFEKKCDLPPSPELAQLHAVWPLSWAGVLPNTAARARIVKCAMGHKD